MTGPNGNSEFCFTNAKPRETLILRGNKTHCFLQGHSLSVMLYLPTQEQKKTLRRNRFLDAGWLTNLL